MPALDRRPELLLGLEFYLNAYLELRYDRPVGMGVGPIPWSSIERWALRHGLDDADELAVLVRHIRGMEEAMNAREEQAEKRKEKTRKEASHDRR